MPLEPTQPSTSLDREVSSFGVRRRLDLRVLELGLFCGLIAFAAFLTNATHALLDDGPQLVQDFGSPDAPPIWNHVLYFPVARAIAAFGCTADQALLLTSCASGAVIVAAAAMCAWMVTGRRSIGAFTAAATMTAPVVATHSTFIEVHALHGACVAIALLAMLACPPRTVVLFGVATVGAVLADLSHRSAMLLAPALGAVAASRFSQARQTVSLATFRGMLAVSLGLAVASLIDERLHGAWGGPGLIASIQQVDAASPASLTIMLVDETAMTIGPLLAFCAMAAAVQAWSDRARIGTALLLVAPAAALSIYCVAIVIAAVPTQGGYWMGALPFLALAFAQCAARWLPLLARGSLLARAGILGAIAIGAVLTVQTMWGDATRISLERQREQRASWASTLLPLGGHLLATSLSKQHVDGVSPGVREHDFGPEIARRLIAGHSPESIAAELRLCIDRLFATDAGAPLVWTCEWRGTEGALAFEAALLRIEAIAFAGLRTTPVHFGPFDGMRIASVERH